MFEFRRLLLIFLGALLLVPETSKASSGSDLDRAATLLKEGRAAEALVLLHAAERQLPEPRRIWNLIGAGYLQLGWLRLNQGDEAGARETFEQARQYLPDDPAPLRAMALVWLHAGHPAAAVGPLHEALTLSGENAELLLLLGRAYYAQGDLSQAEAVWGQAAAVGAVDAERLLEKVRRERRVELDMEQTLAGRFILAYAPEVSPQLAAAVLDVLQEASTDLGRELGYYPDVDIPVFLYAGEDFAAVTHSPAWAAAVYDGKIRVPLRGVVHMTAPLRGLLRHEYAHVVVRFLGKGRVPVWLNEGLAGLAEGPRAEQQVEESSAVAVLPPTALERPFSELPEELVPVAYARSRTRVERLVEACGWLALGDLLRQLGYGLALEAAVAEAFAPCGYDWAQFEAQLGQAGQ